MTTLFYTWKWWNPLKEMVNLWWKTLIKMTSIEKTSFYGAIHPCVTFVPCGGLRSWTEQHGTADARQLESVTIFLFQGTTRWACALEKICADPKAGHLRYPYPCQAPGYRYSCHGARIRPRPKISRSTHPISKIQVFLRLKSTVWYQSSKLGQNSLFLHLMCTHFHS